MPELILSGRTVVITGAARGVGRAIALACAQRGARLILGDVLEDRGRQTAAELERNAAAVRFVPLDLADPAAIERFADDVRAHEGSIHGLVNNGIADLPDPGGGGRSAIITDQGRQLNFAAMWLPRISV
jgi:NAD(P)-dependent dehydrogenase (short-subunit alcohol dehydrogenase family)